MADNGQNGESGQLGQETVTQLSAELGCSEDAVRAMPEMRLAWILNKREIPNRPRARLEQELGALRDDDGKVASDAVARALGQLDLVRSALPHASREVAGMPTGATLFAAAARAEGPAAGLNANNNPIVLGNIVGAFKSISTNQYINGVNTKGWEPFHKRLWQRGFYDHIIRNERALTAIRAYIVNNPANWQEDKMHPNATPNTFNKMWKRPL